MLGHIRIDIHAANRIFHRFCERMRMAGMTLVSRAVMVVPVLLIDLLAFPSRTP